MDRKNLSSTVAGAEEQDEVGFGTDSSAFSDSDSLSEFDSDSNCTDFKEDGRVDHNVEFVSERGTSLGNGRETICK